LFDNTSILPYLIGTIIIIISIVKIKTANDVEKNKYRKMDIRSITSIKQLNKYIEFNSPASSEFESLFTSKIDEGSNLEILKYLIDNKYVQINKGHSMLVYAAVIGQTEVVKLLLKHKASIEAADNNGNTALISAVINNHSTTVELLLKHKANTEATNNDGVTALILAVVHSHSTVVELLLKYKPNIEAADNDGMTALIWAAYKDNSAVVELLLKHKASIEAADNNGNTALILAVSNNHSTTVELLLKHKANTEAINNTGNTALFLAVAHDYSAVVELLLKHKANTEAADNNGNTVLILAVINNHSTAVELLLKHKANTEATNNDGYTALILAAGKGHSTAVELLLKYKANIDTTDNDGVTALIWAVNKGYSTVVELLLKYKPNIEAADNNGMTALIWAMDVGHLQAVQLLLENDAIISEELSRELEAQAVIHKSKGYFDSIKSHLINPIFSTNMYEVKLPGPVIFRIKDFEITKLGVELSYSVVGAEYDSVNWLGYQAEFENRTQLENVKLHKDLGNESFKVLVYGNNSLGRLVREFKIHGQAPKFYDADIINHSCYIFLEKLNGVSIEHWIDVKPLAEDLLNFSIEIEKYNSEHSLWGKYGNSKLMIIKESGVSSLAKILDLSGTFVKESENKGIKNIVYNNVDDSQAWLKKENEICTLLHRQVHVIVDGSKIYLEDNTEEALPALMEWDDNSENPKLLHVKKTKGRVEYYYSYSHKKNLAKWKDAARVVDFKTLFDEPNKVYELQNYDKSNSELWNPEFSKERMIVLCEYDAIPTKEELIGIDVSQELINEEVFWGYGTGSNKYYSKINNLSHMMIIGASGSGKSNFMNGVILSLLKNLNQIQKMYLIDLKSGIEFNRYKGFSEKVDVFSKGTSPSRLLGALREVEAEMYLREEYMSQNGITKLTTDPIFIIIDEYAQIQLMPAKGSESMMKDDIVNTLITIGTRARSANIKLIVQTQDPRAVEDELKVHLMSRALLKTSKEADAGFTLQDDDKAYEMGIKHTSFDQGRYIFEDYNDGNTQTTELQFPFIDPDKKLYEAYSSAENEAYTGIELDEYKESISAQYPHLQNTKLLGNGEEESQEDVSNAQPSSQPQASDSFIDFDSIGDDDVDETSTDSAEDEDDKEIANLAKEGDDLYKALLSQIDED